MVKEEGRYAAFKLTYAAVSLVIAVFVLIFGNATLTAYAEGGLSLSTSYPGISVSAGDSLSISVDLKNATGADLDASVYVASVPEEFEAYLQGGSYQISAIHADSGETASFTLHVTVPYEISEGAYDIVVRAEAGSAYDELTITLNAAEQHGGAGSFTSEYPSQEGSSSTSFSFSTTIINNGLTDRSYSLSSSAPSGWTVRFTPSSGSTQIAGIDVEAGSSEGLTVSVTPPGTVEAGEYTIYLSAVSADETLSTELTVNITGTYGIDIGTSSGLLSFDAEAGKQKDVTLAITNTGNVDLTDVTINSSLPSDWSVSYDLEGDDEAEANVISSIPAGSTVEVTAHVTPSSDSITGDYVATFTASNSETSDTAEFRVSIKTSTIWGVAAIAIIIAVCGCVAYIFRRYGRR